jgi:hypothetical protein
MENVGTFYVHLEYFMSIRNILRPFGIFFPVMEFCFKRNLTTLEKRQKDNFLANRYIKTLAKMILYKQNWPLLLGGWSQIWKREKTELIPLRMCP